MVDHDFVPPDFVVPRELSGDGFRLEPLHPRHNEGDLAAWTSSVEHIRATPGFGGSWPPPEGMSPEANLRDLERHAADFEERGGFTYSVLDGDTIVGCVYICRDRENARTAKVSSWVRADRAELDAPLHEAVAAWLTTWPFERVRYRT